MSLLSLRPSASHSHFSSFVSRSFSEVFTLRHFLSLFLNIFLYFLYIAPVRFFNSMTRIMWAVFSQESETTRSETFYHILFTQPKITITSPQWALQWTTSSVRTLDWREEKLKKRPQRRQEVDVTWPELNNKTTVLVAAPVFLKNIRIWRHKKISANVLRNIQSVKEASGHLPVVFVSTEPTKHDLFFSGFCA